MTLSTTGLEKIYEGKTKDVYAYSDTEILLYTKDETTGWWKEDDAGNKYFEEDPGGNHVGPAVTGMGKNNLIASDYFFKLLTAAGIPNHYIGSDVSQNLMLVKKGQVLGKGLECIVRFYAMGSLLRRYPDKYKAGGVVENFFETTLKSDAENDPPITEAELIDGGVVTKGQYDEVKSISQQAAGLIAEDLAKVGLTLVDIKFEMGVVDGKMMLIDEFSAGVMRVVKGDVITPENILDESEFSAILLKLAQG